MITVAIDGPAGVGKSSVSKALADYFSLAYLDTGAMYRAAAWWCLNTGVDLDDPQAVTDAVLEFCSAHLDIGVDPQNPRVYSDEEDISDAIRSQEVSGSVSKVSSIQTVRQILIDAQRRLIAREDGINPIRRVAVSLRKAAISPPSSLPTRRCAFC